ncbi:MAG: lytic transglycosylase domain-containing protein [Candidatus Binataceae bacterium]
MLAAAAAVVIFTTAAPVCGGAPATPEISPQDSERTIRAVGRMYDLDPSLLAAIAHVESGGNPRAVSPKGAEGIMQLMPATALRFGVLNPFDPISNVLGAARFLAFLRNYHPARTPRDGAAPDAMTLPEMLAAYNAGEGAIDKYRGIPPYAETQQYVRRVLIAYLLGDDRGPLAEKLRAAAFPSRNTAFSGGASVHTHPITPARPSLRRPDALATLGAIRAARAAQIDRESRGIGARAGLTGLAPSDGAK